jgi:hypothetical protein
MTANTVRWAPIGSALIAAATRGLTTGPANRRRLGPSDRSLLGARQGWPCKAWLLPLWRRQRSEDARAESAAAPAVGSRSAFVLDDRLAVSAPQLVRSVRLQRVLVANRAFVALRHGPFLRSVPANPAKMWPSCHSHNDCIHTWGLTCGFATNAWCL